MKTYFRFKMEQFAEKIILAGLLKNARMQVEPCEIPYAGAPEILRIRATPQMGVFSSLLELLRGKSYHLINDLGIQENHNQTIHP